MLSVDQFHLGDKSIGNNESVKQAGKSILLDYPCEDPTTCTYFTALLKPGIYAFETWGAEGGYNGGKGGYSFGTINLIKKTRIYIFIVAKGTYYEMKHRGFSG